MFGTKEGFVKAGLLSFALLMACSPGSEPKKIFQQNLNTGSSLPAVCLDQSPTARPAKLCGEAGYAYLLNTFIRRNCAKDCHISGNTMLLAPIADTDAQLAYQYAVNYPNSLFEKRFLQSPFVRNECLLKEGYTQLNDLREWLDNKIGNCP